MKEKTLDFLKKNYILVICAVCVIISLAALITALVSGGDAEESSISAVEAVWGEGLTEGIPEFSGDASRMTVSNISFVAYYENVSGEQITEYLQTLENECGISLSGGQYPRSAKWGEKLITVHYNATEMLFSVTVSAVGEIVEQ